MSEQCFRFAIGNLIFGGKRELDVSRTRAGITLVGTLSKAKIVNPFESYNITLSAAYYKEKD